MRQPPHGNLDLQPNFQNRNAVPDDNNRATDSNPICILSAYAKRSSWVGVNGRSGFVYINTLMIQRVLSEPDWAQRMLAG
jgi:hypothetical protein